MQKLVDLFSSREEQIRELLSRSEASDILKVVKSELLSVIDEGGDYFLSLTPRQVQMVHQIIDVSLQALNVFEIQLNTTTQKQQSGTQTASIDIENLLRQSFVATGSSIAGFVAKSLPVGIALSLLVALLEKFIPPLTQQNLEGTNSSVVQTATPDIDTIMRRLHDIYSAIDQAIETQFASVEEPNVIQSSLVQFPDVVDFMYDLSSALVIEGDLLPPLISRHLQMIPQILSMYGLEIIMYSRDNHEDLVIYFNFEPNDTLAKGEYSTERPALIYNKQVIKRGLVLHG